MGEACDGTDVSQPHRNGGSDGWTSDDGDGNGATADELSSRTVRAAAG